MCVHTWSCGFYTGDLSGNHITDILWFIMTHFINDIIYVDYLQLYFQYDVIFIYLCTEEFKLVDFLANVTVLCCVFYNIFKQTK